jgi:hypothetical protein
MGQKNCLGQALTQAELLVACGGVCWAFNLKFKTDVSEQKIDIPTDKSNSLLILKPDRFDVDFEVRSQLRASEVVKQWETAEAGEKCGGRRDSMAHELTT